MLKYTLNGKWLKIKEEMANLGKYNFTRNNS